MNQQTKTEQAEKIITEQPHQECMLSLSDWKNCDALFTNIGESTENKQWFTTLKRMSEYFGVNIKTLESIALENSDDLKKDGVKVVRRSDGDELSLFFKESSNKNAPSLKIFSPRAVLRIGSWLKVNNIGNQITSVLIDNSQKSKRTIKTMNSQNNNKKKKGTTYRPKDEKILECLKSYANQNNISVNQTIEKLLLENDNFKKFVNEQKENENDVEIDVEDLKQE